MSLFLSLPIDIHRLVCQYLTDNEISTLNIKPDEIFWKERLYQVSGLSFEELYKSLNVVYEMAHPSVLIAGGLYGPFIGKCDWPIHDSIIRNDKRYINIPDKNGKTALMRIVEWDYAHYDNIFADLMKNGADINARDKKGNTALMHACCHPDDNNVKRWLHALMAYGANPNIKDNGGCTLLMNVCRYCKDQSIIEMVLKVTENINERDNKGLTALTYASCHTNTDTSEETIKLLIKNGADINLGDNDDCPPLVYAAQNSRKRSKDSTVKLLLDLGADIHHRCSYGTTALIDTVYTTQSDSKDSTVSLLLEAGSDINAQDNQGNSALIVATKFSTRQTAPSTLKLLVEAGANLNLCDNKGLSAIDWCCKTLKPETEQNLLLLLEAGAKLKKNRPYLSQILKSTECNVSLTLIKKLIKAGVDVNIFLPGELTSLMLCVEYSKLEILILLLSIPEIDVSIQGGTQELTAYEMALNKYGPDSSITLLLLTYENRGKKRDYRQTLFSSDIL